MVLHLSNFEIPARFSFQPFVAEWHFVRVETVEWAEEPKLKRALQQQEDDLEKTWVRVRIEAPDADGLGMLYGLELNDYSSFSAVLDRASVPPDVLEAHENHRNTPNISDRYFRALICQKPEFKDELWALKPGEVTKNAWIMRDEFLSLNADPDPALGWDWSAWQFLNKWGLWGFGQVHVNDWDFASYSAMTTLLQLAKGERIYKLNRPGSVMVIPHLLKEQQEKYRKALLPNNARLWLRSHPLNLDTADEFPFFRVRRSYCCEAIEATITIDHLAERRFGICKRCHKVFERETRHKKDYCSERCYNAAGVQRWREKQRNTAKKGANQNAKR
jgi:hypothetical protein